MSHGTQALKRTGFGLMQGLLECPLQEPHRTEETPELMDLGYLSTDFDVLCSAPQMLSALSSQLGLEMNGRNLLQDSVNWEGSELPKSVQLNVQYIVTAHR